MFKKLMAMLCALVMVFALCSCGNNSGGGKKELTKLKDLPGHLIVEEMTELTVFMRAAKTDDGRKPIMHDAAEMTNVLLTPTLANSNSNWKEAFNMMVASGEMPDLVMNYTEMLFNDLGTQGAFLPLDEYIDEYCPNIAKFLDAHPEVVQSITANDGHIYYLPIMFEGETSYGWFVRQDWLDKLNLKAPTNAEELHDVLYAFRNEDPNGNGKKDEIPFFDGPKLKAFYPMWNARNTWYAKDDKVVFGPYEENYKNAVKELAKWYSEGLFDPEIMTRSGSLIAKALGDNTGGMTHAWIGSTCGYNDTLKDSIPGFNFEVIAPPGGVEVDRRHPCGNYGWGINANSDKIAIALAYMDFWFTEEASRMVNYGKEGVHYDMVDGKPVLKKEFVADPDFQTKWREYGVGEEWAHPGDFEAEKQWLNARAVKGMELYIENDYFDDIYPKVELALSKEELKEYTALKTAIDTYAQEMEQKWILGSEDVDKTWDAYIKNLESLGIDRLTELNQMGYDRIKSRG